MKTKEDKIRAMFLYLTNLADDLTLTEINLAIKRLKKLGVSKLEFANGTIEIQKKEGKL
jgi:hypothetical protein